MAFDTERAARRLTDAGLDEPGLDEGAANGVADVVGSATNGLATEASLLAFDATLQAGLAAVREEILELKAQTTADLAKLETRLIKWTVGAVIAAAGAAAAIATAAARLIG